MISQLSVEFSIKDPWFLHHFLEVEVHQCGTNMFLTHTDTVSNFLTRANMNDWKPLATPMPSKGRHLSPYDKLFHDPTTYRGIVRGLQ